MYIVNQLNERKFTLNGVEYFKNYISVVHGNRIEVFNCFERKDVRIPLTHFSEVSVNGSTYTSAIELQENILDVIYSRSSLSENGGFDQNNKLRTISLGFTSADTVPITDFVNKMNLRTTVITSTETPVILVINQSTFTVVDDFTISFQTTKKYTYFFRQGKGTYGVGGTTVTRAMLEPRAVMIFTPDDIDPSTITNIDPVVDGDYITKANTMPWDFGDSGTEIENGNKQYYLSFTNEQGKLSFALFVGLPGQYGVGGTPLDNTMFIITAQEDTLPQITNLSQLNNDVPYATVSEVDGMTISVNQAAAELYLKNDDGTTLATVSLGFLNNEGTTFFYNATTGNLELKDDAGNVLSVVPVSAFVSNLIQSVNFNAGTPYILEFKDAAGNVVDSVSFAISNIQGLQTALNGKANTNGSNATGTWPISISGTAYLASKLATTGGESTWHWADGVGAGVPMTWFWGGQSPSDMYVYSPLSFPISTATQAALNLKANDANVLHTTGNETKNGNITQNVDNGTLQFKLTRSGNTVANLASGSGGADLFGLLQLYGTVGVESVRIYASGNSWFNGGNVGFGTSSPSTTVDVNGTTKTNTLLVGTSTNPTPAILRADGIIEFDGSAGFNLTQYKSAGTTIGLIGQGNYVVSGGSATGFAISGTNLLQFAAGGVIGITLNTSGNTGFGGSASTSKVNISNGAGGNQLAFERGTGRALFGQEDNVDGLLMYVGDAGSEILAQRWHASGNVSIGSPYDNGYKFDVNGAQRVNGALTVIGEVYGNTASFSGQVSVATATLPSSAVRLGQMTIPNIPDLEDKLQELSEAIDAIELSVIEATKTIDFPTLSSHAAAWMEVEIIGAAVGDFVQVVPPVSLLLDDSFFNHVAYDAFVSAADKVRLRMQHTAASPSTIDIPTGDYKFRIQK